MVKQYTKSKTPHFFIYAKDKSKKNVEPINNSVVNRLETIIPNTNINFKADGLDKFDYKMLMLNPDVEIDDLIVKEYTELDLKKHFILGDSEDDDREDKFSYLYQEIRRKLLQINSDSFYVTDVLIKYLYFKKKSQFKTTLWSCFGDILVENLKRNVATKQKYCEVCGDLIKQVTNNQEYCKKCWKDIERKLWRENKRKHRNVQVQKNPLNHYSP